MILANIPTAWTSNLRDPKQKQEFEVALRNSTTAITRLLEILDSQESSLESLENTIDQFNTPSWSERQAWINGKKAQIKSTRDLFNFIKG